jgi:predicted RecA/RadA family phage recombinase
MGQAVRLGEGDEEIVTAPSGGYASGEIVQAPSGRAGYVNSLNAVPEGEKCTIKTTGRVKVPSASATTFALAAAVQWNNTTNLAVASGDFLLGPASKAKINGDTVVEVILNGTP